MRDSSTNSPRQTCAIRECKCGSCGTVTLTTSGTKCLCSGTMNAVGADSVLRKAYGLEDTDIRKGGLR